MRVYYLVIDYNGWCPFIDDNREFRFMSGLNITWEYRFSTTCLDVANAMCRKLNSRKDLG